MIELRCPACGAPLQREPRLWHCAQRHSFDVAREGYVNLLLVQHKRSLDPGDTAESLQARRAFLDAGHYAPLRDAVVAHWQRLRPASLLDLGCGEGYYTAGMAQVVPDVVGLDIAKPAIQLAAKRYRGPTWLVGNGARLPVADASLDALSCLFTPLHPHELHRALRPGGELLVVTPGPAHLESLRASLFDRVEPHVPEKFLDTLAEGFEPLGTQTLEISIDLDRTALARLVTMTPYAWKARPEKRDALLARDGLRTTAGFCLMRLRRKA